MLRSGVLGITAALVLHFGPIQPAFAQIAIEADAAKILGEMSSDAIGEIEMVKE